MVVGNIMNINIPKFNFPIYIIIILIAIFLGLLYVIYSLKKEKIKINTTLYIILNMLLILFLGKTFTMITTKSWNFLFAGLSSYGGLMGMVLSSLIFEKTLFLKGYLLKYQVISLPLIYGISKIACFLSGCCYGIPANIISVTYIDTLNIPLFPIQLLEAIIFIIIFVICNKLKNEENIIAITILISAFFKFSLDFLRYNHLEKLITINQIISIILVIISLFYLKLKRSSPY